MPGYGNSSPSVLFFLQNVWKARSQAASTIGNGGVPCPRPWDTGSDRCVGTAGSWVLVSECLLSVEVKACFCVARGVVSENAAPRGIGAKTAHCRTGAGMVLSTATQPCLRVLEFGRAGAGWQVAVMRWGRLSAARGLQTEPSSQGILSAVGQSEREACGAFLHLF